GRKASSLSEFHNHAPAIFGSSRTPWSDGFFKSSRRAAGSLNRTISGGYFRSFSSFVTAIASTNAETRCGFGRCWYQFHVHAIPHESRKTTIKPDAVICGCAWLKPAQAARLFENHLGGLQENRPKIADAVLATTPPKRMSGRIIRSGSFERKAGIFML